MIIYIKSIYQNIFFKFWREVYIPHHQCFPSSVRGNQENPLSRGIGNFTWGIFFLLGKFCWWESDKEWFCTSEPFSKLKTRFCKYWTSIKIKISTTCMYRDYKFEIKMVQEQWLQQKWSLYGVLIWKLLSRGGEGRTVDEVE